jgi:UDP-N-acetylglucosamine:LPS N-acetylglucosamine transferase
MVDAWLPGAAALIHQQDVLPGLANRLLVPFAQLIT